MRYVWCMSLVLFISGLTACSPIQDLFFAAEPVVEFERRAFGGRLFDMWYDEIEENFVPDDPDTPRIDGHGGPHGNGTLNGADGEPIENTGHD